MDNLRSGDRTGIYEQLARVGKVVVHPKRIELLELLCQGERSVETLAAATSLKLTTASAHLQMMRQARLVVTRRDGVRVYYRAAGEEVCRFVAALGDLARARFAEVDRILREIGAGHDSGAGHHSTERVTRAELLARVRTGDVVVIDVRPQEEYRAGHIPGALSIPLEHLEARLDELDSGVETVAYCRGSLCLLAPQAVAVLRSHGHEARCLEEGMPEWRQASLPVTSGADPSPPLPGREERGAAGRSRQAHGSPRSTRSPG